MNWLGKKELECTSQIPWYYGLCYPCDFGRWYVCYPVPLNWIVWASIEVWARMRSTPDGLVYRSYQQGKRDGYRDGYDTAMDVLQHLSAFKDRPTKDDFNHPLNKAARGERV